MSKDTKEATQHESVSGQTSGNVAPTLDYSDSAALVDKKAEEDAAAVESLQAMTPEETQQKRDEYEATLPHGTDAAPGTEGAVREAEDKAKSKAGD